jgi:hypothetical protein
MQTNPFFSGAIDSIKPNISKGMLSSIKNNASKDHKLSTSNEDDIKTYLKEHTGSI